MKTEVSFKSWIPLLAVFSLILSGCVAESVTDQTVSGEISTVTPPLVAPSVGQGEIHYRQYCSSCHSLSTSVQTDSAPKVNLISTDWLKDTTPTAMFTYLTAGNTENGMPSFSSLSGKERWDLVAYLLTLVSAENSQASSNLIYQNMCQSCHGSDGSGNGSQAISQELTVSDWRNEPLLIDYSNTDLYNIISNGTSHGMEKFAVMLNEAQMWSLVGTARSLSLQSPATAANRSQIKTGEDSGSDSELSQGEDVFLIEGKVTNGSGGELDELGEVKLVIASDGQTLQELTAPLTQNGAFDFIAVPYSSDWNYTAQIEENGVVYKSVRLSGKSIAASDTVSLKIKMYDVASDLAVLRGERLHVLLDFKDESTIHVTESLLISNPSSYTISPANAQSALLQFTLNSDAQGIKFDDFSGEEYLKVSNGVVGDWQPILPGSVHQVMFEYDLPFKGEKTIEFNAPVQIISAMVVVENGTKNIACTGMHLSNQNMTLSEPVLLFTGVNIEAGGKLALHCYDKKNFFPVVIGISALGFAVLVVILIAVEVKRKGKNINRAAGKGVKRNNLLDAVIALDDQFKAGEISAETYRDKREELIKKLEGE